jgi:hypothetical protein
MTPCRSARFNAWAETFKDHPEATASVLDPFRDDTPAMSSPWWFRSRAGDRTGSPGAAPGGR